MITQPQTIDNQQNGLMKFPTLFFIVLAFLLSISSIRGQACLPDGITFLSQQQIDNFPTDYPGCTQIEGNVLIQDTFVTYITNLNGLANLTSIGGDLKFADTHSLTTLSGLDNLTSIGGKFELFNATKLSTLDGLSNLTSIGGGIEIFLNDSLSNLDGLSNLTSIGWGIKIEAAFGLTNVDGLSNLDSISGGLAFLDNSELTNLDGLAGITYVPKDISLTMNPKLTNLNGLANITSIGGSLNIYTTVALTDLDGLANLTSVGKDLSIVANSGITNLNGLSKLTSVGGYLDISENSALEDCCAIQNLVSSPDAVGESIYIKDNPSECSNIDEVLLLSCNQPISYISGLTYYDINQNKVKDADEPKIPAQKIWFDPPGHTLLTSQNGNFFQYCDSGEVYNFHWIPDSLWALSTDSAQYTIQFQPGLPADNYREFGLYPPVPFHHEEVSISGDYPICNSYVFFTILCKNLGTYVESGKIVLSYDSLSHFINSTDADFVIDSINHQLTWTYDNLTQFTNLKKHAVFYMPDSMDVALNYLVTVYRDSAGVEVVADEYSHTPLVLCSFDPNDKQVMPAGVRAEHYTLHDQKLTYTIRFQNTGTAPAKDIRILDTLDDDLDINTFRIVNSSFPVQTAMDGPALEFLFKDIWLADSTNNEPESHGFVTYQVQPKPGLADYTEIENTAYIIFDSNDPVVTNTTKNTMISMIPVALNEINQTKITIRPNPADDVIHISAKNQQDIDKVLIYNNLGELVLAQKGELVDVSRLPKGLYLVKVQVGKQMGMAKLMRL